MAQMVNREAPYSGLANLMAMRGRMGDTELVHMSKPEIKGLASLGQLTVNPDTGLPEAFKLKSLLPTIAGIGAAVATGGTSLLIPAVATGLTSAVVNKDIGRGLFDGLLSYAGGSIMRGLSGGGEAFGELAKPAAATVTTATPSAAASKVAQEFTAAQMAQVSPTAASAMSAGLPVGGPAIPAGGMLAPFPASSGIGSMVPGGLTPSVPLTTSISPAAGTFTAVKDITPSFVGRQLGYETIKQGATLTPMQVAQLGGGTAGLTTSQMAGLYAPQAAVGVGGAMLQDAMTPEYQQPELLSGTVSTPRTPRTLTRTPLRRTPVTEEEALGAALGTGPALRFSDYTTRYANQGGLVGYATGGDIETGALANVPPHIAREIMENPEIVNDATAFNNLVNTQPSTTDLMMGGGLSSLFLEGYPPHMARAIRQNPEVLNDATALKNLFNIQPSAKDLLMDGGLSNSFLANVPPHIAREIMENPEVLTDAAAFSNLVNTQLSATNFMVDGGLVGFATGGGIPAIKEAGDPSNDPQANVGTGVVGNVNVTDPVDIGLGAFNPSPLGMATSLAGLALGIPGLGPAVTIGRGIMGLMGPSVPGQQFGFGTTTGGPTGIGIGVTGQAVDPDFEAVSDGYGGTGMGGEDSGSGDQGDTGVGHGAGEGTSEEGAVATGGLIGALAAGGRPYFEGMVPGDAHGMKDNVAFKVQGGNIDTAMLSPGEYVIPADVVAMLGNGNGDSGAKQLDAFAKGIRQKAFGTKKQQKEINAPKELGQLATA